MALALCRQSREFRVILQVAQLQVAIAELLLP